MPLTFRDALPDSWGRKVLEAKHGHGLSDVEALLLTNADRVGAMVFSASLPIEPARPDATVFKLDDLANAARRLEMGLEPAADLRPLLQGGTLGGARPKATFIHEGRRHIAKFPARGDTQDIAVLEAATLGLARACGIHVPEFFLLPVPTGHALVLRRFDREGGIDEERRLHYLSASALLNVAYEDNTGGSYVELAQALRRISVQPEADLQELYRRMVFNLVAGNSDDHVKNHGVLLSGNGRYRLAPAFDLVMQLNGNTGYQLLAISPGKAESSLGLARQAAAQFGLSESQAEAVIQHVRETVRSRNQASLKEYGADAALMRQAGEFLEKQDQRIQAA
jgi:serine/threonine-protein kinase HipA